MRSSTILAALGAAGLAAAQTTSTSDSLVPVSTIVVSSPSSVASSKFSSICPSSFTQPFFVPLPTFPIITAPVSSHLLSQQTYPNCFFVFVIAPPPSPPPNEPLQSCLASCMLQFPSPPRVTASIPPPVPPSVPPPARGGGGHGGGHGGPGRLVNWERDAANMIPRHPHQPPPVVTFPPFPPPRAPIPIQPPRPVHSLLPPRSPEEFVHEHHKERRNEHKRNMEERSPHVPVHSFAPPPPPPPPPPFFPEEFVVHEGEAE